MLKNMKLLPWLFSVPTSDQDEDCSPPPIEKEHISKTRRKCEKSARRSGVLSAEIRPNNGIGEGDRQPAARVPTRAVFKDKPPAVPLWLACVEVPPSASRSPNRSRTRAAELPHSVPSPSQSFNSTQENLKAWTQVRAQRLAVSPAETVVEARSPGSQSSLSTLQTLTHTVPKASTRDARPVSANSGSRSVPTSGADVYRSIAVQAHNLEVVNNAANACFECRRRGDSSRSDEWVDGARALRDSHVRFVVQQLRHIELLNHAIDGAASPTYSRSDGSADDASDSCISPTTAAWPPANLA